MNSDQAVLVTGEEEEEEEEEEKDVGGTVRV
jgi:hypothetical protein